MPEEAVTRRGFIKAILTAFGLKLEQCLRKRLVDTGSLAGGLDHKLYLPFVGRDGAPLPHTPAATATSTHTPTDTPTATATPTETATPIDTPTSTPTPSSRPTMGPSSGKVVHVHDGDATSWDFGNDYYGREEFVNQDVVNEMVDRGVKELAGTSSVAQAWQVLVPGYGPGKVIAIKVNQNNQGWCVHRCETDCEEWRLKLDALINPVNAVVRGLKQIGVAEEDIWVYDATNGRRMPGRFTSRCLYPGVQFYDYDCHNPARFDSDEYVTFFPPPGTTLPAEKITDVVVGATYLINMPIMRRHGGTEVTLGFKNHFGSIDQCGDLHPYVYWDGEHYSAAHNPLVDIYRNPHIADKTVLTVGDALYGGWRGNVYKPQPWETFGKQAANSLFFATDPVAVDCVMCDFLNAEDGWMGPLRDMADDYLMLAGSLGLGTYERGDPWGSGYAQIEYLRIEL